MGTTTEDYRSFSSPSGRQNSTVDGVTQASAATMPTPRALLTVVSGTAAITLIPIPWPGFTGFICYRPTGAFTGATGGSATDTNKPIGLAFTAVVGKILYLYFDGSLWYPSYTA